MPGAAATAARDAVGLRRLLVVLGLLAAVGAIAGEQPVPERAALVASVLGEVSVPDLRAQTPAPSELLAAPAELRALQAEPLRAHVLARGLRDSFVADSRQPTALLARVAALYAPGPSRPDVPGDEAAGAADPLAMALQRLWRMEGLSLAAVPALPDDLPAHRALRAAVAGMLQAIVEAEALRRRAFAAVPLELTASRIVGQWAAGSLAPAPEPEQEALLRAAVSVVDRQSLVQGMHRLAGAAEHLVRGLPGLAQTASVVWRLRTPWGMVLVDTSGTHQTHALQDPLLVIDVGGDDHYIFKGRSASNRVSLLLDVGGNDRYEAAAPASDASTGVLGYGVLWDTEGDDHYRGGWLTQGAAMFGASLHVDEGGSDHYEAVAMAQGFAWAGFALLVDRSGHDRYRGASHAQASAGPGAVAVLLDAEGDDRYWLGAESIVVRSPQLPDRNTSMGQGAGRGLQATALIPALAGGVGVLLDLSGNDHYRADVFAQGAGYFFGVGMLIDSAGHDRFEAAWYAMGAAAHAGAGLLLKDGVGNDEYHVSHSTGLGAAHDRALAIFRDEGGDDVYRLGNLGFGAAQDASVALFVDVAGEDRYASGGPPCYAFGVARRSPEGSTVPMPVGLGVFWDQDGRGHPPPQCPAALGGVAWSSDNGQTSTGAGPGAVTTERERP